MDSEGSSIGTRSPAIMGDSLRENEDLWGNLLQEALVEIFNRLPFEDRLRVIPNVCKGWRKASYDPSCWTVVDMGPWIQRKIDIDFWWGPECEAKVEHLVKAVVDRSCGHIQELRTMYISDKAVDYIAERCPELVILSITNSMMVTDRSAVKLSGRVPMLKQLDVSDCANISNQALEAFGRNCPHLTWLGRNMLNLDLYNQDQIASSSGVSKTLTNIPGGDDEAEAVSKHMGKLKHLEVKKGGLSDHGLRTLVSGCRELENLDLACCTALSPQALAEASRDSPNLNLTLPITPRLQVFPVGDESHQAAMSFY